MNRFQQMMSWAWNHIKSIVPVILGIAVLILIVAWMSGAFESKIEPGQTEIRRMVLSDQPTDIVHEVEKEYIEEAVGTLKAASRSVVSSRVLAPIQAIHVAAGDRVRQGDTLIELDTKELDARLSQAGEAVAAATADRSEAESEFARAERLIRTRAISQREFDQAKRALEVARANVRQAEQAVLEAEALLSYSKILAPKNGRIVDRMAEPGDIAQPGQPILALYDATSLRLEAPVLEKLALQLMVGQQLSVYVDSIDQTFDATIDEIVPQADSRSRSFLVKASLPRADHLFEGMFGRLRIPGGSRRHLCLATDAIQRIGQLEFVDVVRQDNTLERRLVKTGQLGMPGRVELLSGLKSGERVVLYSKRSENENR